LNKVGKDKGDTILDPPRCAICGTSVTLYPMGYVKCPHCGRPVCRQCWGVNWFPKAFDAEKCSHIDGSAGPAVVPIGEKLKRPRLDYSSGLVTATLVALTLLIIYLLWDLFAF
jgi:hypothetical protein